MLVWIYVRRSALSARPRLNVLAIGPLRARISAVEILAVLAVRAIRTRASAVEILAVAAACPALGLSLAATYAVLPTVAAANPAFSLPIAAAAYAALSTVAAAHTALSAVAAANPPLGLAAVSSAAGSLAAGPFDLQLLPPNFGLPALVGLSGRCTPAGYICISLIRAGKRPTCDAAIWIARVVVEEASNGGIAIGATTTHGRPVLFGRYRVPPPPLL